MAKYQRVRVIGKGSFGAAILVRQGPELYVMKEVMLTGLTAKQKDEAAHEAHVLSQLQHPYIVKYIDSGMTSTKLWIVMEYASGGDLDGFIKSKKQSRQRMTVEDALGIFAQLAAAIQYIHSRKILHRDLKSSNCFLTSTPRPGDVPSVRLGDFGISRVLDCTQAYAKTAIGTPYYLSPEICNERPYSFRADVWSAGVILFECLALHVPFNGTNLQQLVKNIMRQPTPAIPKEYHHVPGLCDLVAGLLTKDPGRRPVIQEVVAHPLVSQALAFVQQQQSQSGNTQEAVASAAPGATQVLPRSQGRQLPKAPAQPKGGRRPSAAVTAIERSLKQHQQRQARSVAQYAADHDKGVTVSQRPPSRDGGLGTPKHRRRPQQRKADDPDVVWLGHHPPLADNKMQRGSPMKLEADTLTPSRMPRRGHGSIHEKAAYVDQRARDKEIAKAAMRQLTQQAPVHSQRPANAAVNRSSRERARRLHHLKKEEEGRQQHRPSTSASRRPQNGSAIAPTAAQPVYDPFAAAREAYEERHRQAARNAARINADLGRAPINKFQQGAPNFNNFAVEAAPPMGAPSNSMHHLHQGAAHVAAVRRAGQQQRAAEQAAYEAELARARKEAAIDRMIVSERVQNQHQHPDNSAMLTDDDISFVDVQPLGPNGTMDDDSSPAERVLESKARRRQQEDEQRRMALEQARLQALEDKRQLALRMQQALAT